MVELTINALEQALLDLLLAIPPKYEEARQLICQEAIGPESITKVGIRYASMCAFEFSDWRETHTDLAENEWDVAFPLRVIPGLHSTHIYDVVKFLLGYGLDPNGIFRAQDGPYNVMEELLFVDHEYLAADTIALILEHGGDPTLVVEFEPVFETVDFDIWFGNVEQEERWRYDQWVHVWMVLAAYGGITDKNEERIKVYQEYDSDKWFDLKKLRNHRDYYFGLSRDHDGTTLHIYDKASLWEVATYAI